uniref:Glycosyltransferase 28 domain n=1 Tax=Rhodopseudomonas palustris (strain DX-1) TaxID=652103 RepID=E6VQ48_RHOPX
MVYRGYASRNLDFSVGDRRNGRRTCLSPGCANRAGAFVTSRRRPRVLFLVHDGRGYGHLRRACRLADSISQIACALVVTGNEAVASLAPASIDYVKLPNIGRMNHDIGKRWGMSQFIEIDRTELSRFRQTIVRGVTDAFNPDVIVIDHLPLGKFGEWSYAVLEHPSQKLLVLRPVLGTADQTRADILAEGGLEALKHYFDQILVAGDIESSTIIDELQACDILRSKVTYLGYVTPTFSEKERNVARRLRGLPSNGKWIVCSGGSGHRAEQLLSACKDLSGIYQDYFFDIALGSRMAPSLRSREGRVRVASNISQLDLAHASADLVICHGGYNTLMEALAGSAAVVVLPTSNRDDEQLRHAAILARSHSVEICKSISELPEIVRATLKGPRLNQNGRRLSDGRSRFADIIRSCVATWLIACST